MFAPASDPAGSGAVELAGVPGQTDGSDVVSEHDGAAEFHQGDVIVEGGFVVPRMNDDLGHIAIHLVLVRSTLTLSSNVDHPDTRDVSWRKKNK